MDLYYCLDASGSMNDNNGWPDVKQAAVQVFNQDQAKLNMLQTSRACDEGTLAFGASARAGVA